jgi:hypothetical protein
MFLELDYLVASACTFGDKCYFLLFTHGEVAFMFVILGRVVVHKIGVDENVERIENTVGEDVDHDQRAHGYEQEPDH